MAFTLNPATVLGPEFYGFLLPWIFTFAVVYGLLTKMTLFGSKNDKISTALSFVIAFFVTGAAGPQMAAFFINLFGGAVTYIAGILVIILFAALLGRDLTAFNHVGYLAAVIIIGIALFLGSTGSLIGNVVIGSDIAALAFWLVVIIVAVYMIVGPDGKSGGGGGKKPGE